MALKINYNSLLYHQSALELGLESQLLEYIDGALIRIAKKNYYFRGGDTPFNYASSVGIAKNKYCMNRVLHYAGIPVPKATAILRTQFEKASYSLDDLQFPLVAKPTTNSSTGTDVLCNIKDEFALHSYLETQFKIHKCMSIEEFHNNLRYYRILVFYNQVVGVLEGLPAEVIGDGINSISELINLSNIDRNKLADEMSLGPIVADSECLLKLEEMGMSLDYTPPLNERIQLCYTNNSSRGGTMISPNETICKENSELAIRAAKALNLNLVGFDVLCERIDIPIEKSKGVFIEANYNPDISIHEKPTRGISNRISKTIMRKLICWHPFSYLGIRLKKIAKSLLLIWK